MNDPGLADLPDDAYRAHWLAFHDQLDWSTHEDVTHQTITFDGPDALYRRNKGSFMERVRPDVHCRPYAGHVRRAKRTGAWISDEKLFEASLIPALDLTRVQGHAALSLGQRLRKVLHLPVIEWTENAALTVTRSPQLKG